MRIWSEKESRANKSAIVQSQNQSDKLSGPGGTFTAHGKLFES